MGPVTGYRAIGEWIETEGRVTRNFYSLTGGERTHPEVWKNYKDALDAAGFEIIAEGMFPDRNAKGDIGGGGWQGVYYANNPWGEAGKAETGLVVANADAMGKDIEERGRTALDGLQFEHDSATLMAESKPALDEIAKLLKALDVKNFYVVGHTDSTGTYAYNVKLSADRAMAVRAALVQDYGIASERLESAGVGPLEPVFTNSSEGGRASNRRVELVER